MKVDASRTKAYYDAITVSSLCDCAYCRSYRYQVKAAFPKVAEYLASLGVDIEKPFETSPLEPDEAGMLVFCGCQYIVLGNCRAEYHRRIDGVEVRVAVSYPQTGLEQEHFVLELFPIQLPYIGEG